MSLGPAALQDPGELAPRVRARDARAIGRALSWLEEGDARGGELLARLRSDGTPQPQQGWRIGVTGAPGGGKSTLVDRLVERWRAAGRRVAVVAVDPSSPFSGGALLGDRIRMTRWHADPEVFVRSMATRGRLGGLADAALRAAALLEAAGFDRIVLETVGVGQSEVDVAAAADTTVVVLTPAGGDDVQAIKAGVMEVADVCLVNKSDLPGADRLRRHLLAAQGHAPASEGAWRPAVVACRADVGDGIDEALAAIDAHRAWRSEREEAPERERRRAQAELAAAVRAHADRRVHEAGDAWVEAVRTGRTTADAAAARLLSGGDDAVASDA